MWKPLHTESHTCFLHLKNEQISNPSLHSDSSHSILFLFSTVSAEKPLFQTKWRHETLSQNNKHVNKPSWTKWLKKNKEMKLRTCSRSSLVREGVVMLCPGLCLTVKIFINGTWRGCGLTLTLVLISFAFFSLKFVLYNWARNLKKNLELNKMTSETLF